MQNLRKFLQKREKKESLSFKKQYEAKYAIPVYTTNTMQPCTLSAEENLIIKMNERQLFSWTPTCLSYACERSNSLKQQRGEGLIRDVAT